MTDEIPEVVIERLPLYVRTLELLVGAGQEVISSRELGDLLGVTPAQIRKDLSYFGRFGKQGRGYAIAALVGQLRSILGLDRRWRMALVGVGHLGRAILAYDGFARQGFDVALAFDADPRVVGTVIDGVPVHDIAVLPDELGRSPVDIGIIAVPARAAQAVADRLVECGIFSILNYAPATLRVPAPVHVRTVDPVLQLQSMTYYLKSAEADPVPSGA